MTRLIAFVLAAFIALPAHAEQVWGEFSGYWEIYAWQHESGARHCGAYTGMADNRSSLILKFFRPDQLTIHVGSLDWRLTEGQQGSVIIKSGAYVERFRFTAFQSDTMEAVLDYEDAVAFLTAWAGNHQMELDFPRARGWTLNLEGTANGLGLLFECVNTFISSGRPSTSSGNPI